jgi:hypothetical protein
MSKYFTTYIHVRTGTLQYDGKTVPSHHEGAVTACCRVNRKDREMQCGFSAFNPADKHWMKKNGRERAYSRWLSDPVLIEGIEVEKSNGKEKLLVRKRIVEFLKTANALDMGLEEYGYYDGRAGEFEKWFGSFQTRLREIYPN